MAQGQAGPRELCDIRPSACCPPPRFSAKTAEEMGSQRGTGGAARGARLSPECRPDVAVSALTTHTCVLRGWRQGPGIRAGPGLRGSCGARWARKACHVNRVGMNWCHLIFLHLDVNCESSKNKQLCHLTSGTLLFSSNSFLTYECTRAVRGWESWPGCEEVQGGLARPRAGTLCPRGPLLQVPPCGFCRCLQRVVQATWGRRENKDPFTFLPGPADKQGQVFRG